MDGCKERPVLALVLPCYNEEEVLPISINELSAYFNGLITKNVISDKSFCLFVDDGSKDNTWEIISNENKKKKWIKGIKLLCNVGHQNALFAGLSFVKDKVNCAISIDADLQDDISVIEKMVNNYLNGSEIVYGVRDDRETDTFFKKHSAQFFYRLMGLLGVKLVYNHGDFRLLGEKSLLMLSKFNERNIFLRGLLPTFGFNHSIVQYKRLKRKAGYTKYSFFKMFALAFDAITSFSIVPLRFFLFIGILFFFFSIAMSLWIVYTKIFTENALPGWASTLIPIYFIGGIQLLSISFIGEYLSKIFLETKKRPKFSIEEEL